jgi:hypothetical protein
MTDFQMRAGLTARSLQLAGIPTDIVPAIASDTVDLPEVAVGLLSYDGGDVAVITVKGAERTVTVAAGVPFVLAIARIKATGTTATALHYYTVS